MRRLTGPKGSHTQWTNSSPPPPTQPPASTGGQSALVLLPHQELVEISPPPHDQLTPDLGSLSDENLELLTQSALGAASLVGTRPRSLTGVSGCSTTSNWWDNYCDRSSYEVGEQEFWSTGRDIRKIPIVSTDISDLGFSSSDSDTTTEVFSAPLTTMAPTAECTEAANKLVSARNILQVRVDLLDPDDIDSTILHTVPGELDSIRDLLTNFMVDIRNFLEIYDDELDATIIASWQEESKKAKKLVMDHKKLIWAKYNTLNPAQPLSYFEQQSLTNQNKQLSLQEQNVDKTVGVEQTKILGIAQVKYDALVTSSKKILETIRDRDRDDLIEEDDEKIRKYMRELKDMNSMVTKFLTDVTEFKEHTVLFKLSEDKHTNVDNFQTNVERNFASYVKHLEEQDSERSLFTLDTTPGETVKWPKFSGNIEENFSTFKEKFDTAARLNRASRTVQLTKLRECLSGYPLKLVPETTSDITEALRILTDLYGNVSRVLAFQKKKLAQLGSFPSDTDVESPKKKMQWLMDIKQIIQEYINIGDSGDTRMFCEAFSVSSVGQFINAFPPSMAEKLTSIEYNGDGRDQLEGLLEKVEKMRMKAQRVDIHNSLNPRHTQTGGGAGKKANLFQGWENQKQELLQDMKDKPPGKSYVEVNNLKLRVHKNCKICIHAKSSDPSVDFSGHLGIWTTGCPVYNKMDTAQRSDVARALEVCLRCLNPTKRIIDRKKMICGSCKPHRFTCRFMGKSAETKCLLHIWTCCFHKNISENKEVMKDYNKIWQSKTGGAVVMVAKSSVTAPTTKESGKESDQPKILKSFSLNSNPASLATAARRLKRNEKKRNPEVEFVPVPEGQSLFLFCPVEGKTRDLNFFQDSGCSSALFKTGVPGSELRGQVIEKGPFIVEGVNGVKITAGDEWLVQLKRSDGRIQLMKGLTMDVITGDFPKISTAKAVQEVKEDLPSCLELQACRVPDLAGGSVDALVGILYNAIHPTPIHTLPSGLTIYKTKLKSRHDRYNATIGGPHKTFEYLAGELGGAAALLTIFRQGLEKYHKLGPPKVKAAPLIAEEIDFYTAYNTVEASKEVKELIALEQVEEKITDKFDEKDPSIMKHLLPNPPTTLLICGCGELCSNLEDSSAKAHANISEEERIKDLNSLKLHLQEGGLEISYRCVRCRDCLDCKNSAKTDHLTLREEAEMELIRNSVVLDFEKKRIICTLPLRGPEEDFLTTNRDRALKVLEQQCRKYHSDLDTKETVLKAFRKIFDNGHAGPVENLSSEELEAFSGKQVSYYIPWRVVFSDSLSTPCRPVLDGSSRTRQRPDGRGGRCLNDLVAKGKIDTINLVKMILRFCIGNFAFCGDLQQFYNSCKLKPEFWNLQRFLWKPDLDPKAEVIEMVMKTLIYGVKSVSCQSEEAKIKLAEAVKDIYPEVYALIIEAIYVDDIGDSKASMEACKQVMKDADTVFSMVSLKVKDWSVSGTKPSDTVSKDGLSVGVGGLGWNPFLDCLEIKIPGLHFGRKNRGRLTKQTEIFLGNSEDLEKFVPGKLTRRQVASKFASIFDVLGKLGPILIGAKLDLRKTFKETDDWDSPMPIDLRHTWVQHFWRWEQLRGIKYSRAVMPEDACSTQMRLTTAVDMAEDCLSIGVWAGFQRKDGSFSCQHLISRTVLAAENCSVPKGELEALTGGSNLCSLVRSWLGDWIESYIIVSDSTISLFWVSSEHKRLSLFHRNRVLQILRGSSVNNLYHVKTSFNPADLGTRPSKVKLEDIHPCSKWICGEEWMTWSVEKAVQEEILKPVAELRMKKEEEEIFNEGCVFDKVPEVLTRGHVLNETRIKKLEQRASFSQYLILPTKFGFRKLVRIYSYIFSFVKKLQQLVKRRRPDLFQHTEKEMHYFSLFHTTTSTGSAVRDIQSNISGLEAESEKDKSHQLLAYFGNHEVTASSSDRFTLTQTDRRCSTPVPTGMFINLSLCYLFRRATLEVKQFNNRSTVEKIAVESDGILLSTSRFFQGVKFVEAGGLKPGDLEHMGIKSKVPILDRFSPLSYCIAQHVHSNLSVHRGPETCFRTSLQHCFIMQGLPLFTELQAECIRCKKIRKKYLQQLMSPLSDHQLTIAPPHWATQMDLFGPVTLFVPGRERETRRNPVMTYKAWVLVLICPVTKLTNIQVVEKSDASGILDALTRMFCEAGVPKVLLCDDDSAIVKALREVELDIRNIEHELFTEYGASFKIVPVSGHNMNGLVERAIRTIQQSLEECGLKKFKLHATGLQTLCKLVENQFNNLPLGFKSSRDSDNSELFKIITPNLLRHGRNNSRSLEGPVRLPGSLSEMAQRVTDIYQAWFRIWSTVAVPRLAHRTKWFNPERNLEIGDIVYFQKDSSGLDSHWTTGRVDEVVPGADGHVREVVVRYRNSSEEYDRLTNRAVRSLVRLHNLDDQNLADDLHELTERLSRVENGDELIGLLSDLGHRELGSSVNTDPELSFKNSKSSNVSISVTRTDEQTEYQDVEEASLAPILTPRSRSPVGHCREDEQLLVRALSAGTDQAPVIVCNRPSCHTPQALGCMARPTQRTSHPATNSSAAPSGQPTTSTASSLNQGEHLGTQQAIPAQLSPGLEVQAVTKCKQCCCVSHHRLADHKLKTGAPQAACDLSDLKLKYCEHSTNLKKAKMFHSVEEMIWSSELDL